MQEIIPLKKDIIFKTKIGEITNVDLDLDYKLKEETIIGNVLLSGTYKMTEASVLEEEYFYKIPFSVALSKRIKKDTIKIEIDDFKYTISKDVLNVKIDLDFSCEEEIENQSKIEEIQNIEEDDKLIEEYFENNNIEDNTENENISINKEEKEIDIDENINNITNNIISNDNNYYTYKVYMIRDGETLEDVCNKYDIKLEDIKEYNDIQNIKVGDKIIIPYSNE